MHFLYVLLINGLKYMQQPVRDICTGEHNRLHNKAVQSGCFSFVVHWLLNEVPRLIWLCPVEMN
jgi:hypothetical protein